MLTGRDIWPLFKKSVVAWNDDYAPTMGAALAYYTMFSLAPLLIIVTAIGGLVFGREAARGELVGALSEFVGPDSARTIQALLASMSQPASGALASVIGLVTLILGATSVLTELQSALDRVWRAPAVPRASVLSLVRSRLLTFGMVVAMGMLLLASLVIGAALTTVARWGTLSPALLAALQVLNIVIGFGVTAALFATAYRILPRARIAWSDVWIGAVITALLFTLGKYAIGRYLGGPGVTSGFGAAGSLVAILVWVYYSAQLMLLGAEFTWVYAHTHGTRAPDKNIAAAGVTSSAL